MNTYNNLPSALDLILIKNELIELKLDWGKRHLDVKFYPTLNKENICLN